jgi:hypothetical protein
MAPILVWQERADTVHMPHLAIRCHSRGHRVLDELELWLVREVENLCAPDAQAGCRLLRLTQAGPDGDAGVGWLIELDIRAYERRDDDELGRVLRDMRLLGLQPTVLETGGGCPTIDGTTR